MLTTTLSLMRFTFYLLIVLITVSSCTDEQVVFQEYMKANEVRMQNKIDRLERIALLDQQLGQAQTIVKFQQALPSFKLFKKKMLPSANAIVIHAKAFEDLAKPIILVREVNKKQDRVRKKLLDSYRIAPKKNVINTAVSLFRHKRFPISQKKPKLSDYREAFQAFEQLKYLVVIHHLSGKVPTLLENNGFTRGVYSGYATVFEVESETCLGSFNIRAGSSLEIKSYTMNKQDLSYYHVMRDYLVNIQQTFKETLKAKVSAVQ